jgi:outer membrane protein TolC
MTIPRFAPLRFLAQKRPFAKRIPGLLLILVCLLPSNLWSQTKPAIEPSPIGQSTAASPSGAPMTLTLQDALDRARINSPQFQAAITEYRLAHEDRSQARAALFPSAVYNNQFLYTQGNGTPSGRYIANNAVHEYVSQLDVHQAFGLSQIADYRRTGAVEALAKAKSEIAERGLVATVVDAYYSLVVGQRKYANTQRAVDEAAHFLMLSQQLEQGGEVAHADVIKAQLQSNERQRDLKEAQLTMQKARLTLAVLIFSDFNQDFTVVDDLQLPESLPAFSEVEALAQKNNPEIRAAMATVQSANHDVTAAGGGHLPTLSLDYFYGIDASRFATKTDGVPNLGSSVVATLSIPLWNWGATQSKVRQATFRRNQAQLELTAVQRQLLGNLHSFYAEAQTARSELETLRSSAELAAESLRLTILRYQAGEASALEVVDAQNTLTQARNSFDEGQARYRLGLANLQTLSGPF